MASAAKRQAMSSSSVHAPHDTAAKPASLSAAWEPLSPKRSASTSKANGASPECLGFRDMVRRAEVNTTGFLTQQITLLLSWDLSREKEMEGVHPSRAKRAKSLRILLLCKLSFRVVLVMLRKRRRGR